MKGNCGHAEAVVDAAVVIAGHAGHRLPLHEGPGATAAAVKKEDVFHRAALLDQDPLVDQHRKPQLSLLEGMGGSDVVGAEAAMVEGHGEAAQGWSAVSWMN